MITRMTLLLTLVLWLPIDAAAQPAVFLVRHAERADSGPNGMPPAAPPGAPAADPELSAAGRVRAESLAAALKDAEITAVYVTELKRTQQTAAPLARALGLTPIVVPANSTAVLVAKVKAQSGNALVVGHSNSVPEIINALGVRTPVQIADTEYDNLFVVVRTNRPTLLRLRYR
jgi:phosphohistidine phosphatase SixA